MAAQYHIALLRLLKDDRMIMITGEVHCGAKYRLRVVGQCEHPSRPPSACRPSFALSFTLPFATHARPSERKFDAVHTLKEGVESFWVRARFAR